MARRRGAVKSGVASAIDSLSDLTNQVPGTKSEVPSSLAVDNHGTTTSLLLNSRLLVTSYTRWVDEIYNPHVDIPLTDLLSSCAGVSTMLPSSTLPPRPAIVPESGRLQ